MLKSQQLDGDVSMSAKSHILINNMKCKRKKTLINKCKELHQICGLKIALILFDEDKNELSEYTSAESFGIAKANEKLLGFQEQSSSIG